MKQIIEYFSKEKISSIDEYVKQASNFHFPRAVNEYLSNKINPDYAEKLDSIDNIEFDIDIRKDVKPYLDNFNEDSFNDDIKAIFSNMRNDCLKSLKKVTIEVILSSAWSPKTGNTKLLNIFLIFNNTDEFYERWIMTKDKKWQIFQNSRSTIEICVKKIDLLSTIQKAIEYYEKQKTN